MYHGSLCQKYAILFPIIHSYFYDIYHITNFPFYYKFNKRTDTEGNKQTNKRT